MKKPQQMFGSTLLRLGLYWAFVYHTGWWTVGISAFAVMVALNAIHLALHYQDRAP